MNKKNKKIWNPRPYQLQIYNKALTRAYNQLILYPILNRVFNIENPETLSKSKISKMTKNMNHEQ